MVKSMQTKHIAQVEFRWLQVELPFRDGHLKGESPIRPECGACAGTARPFHQSVTIAQIERALQTKRSGADTMQDKQHKEETFREWNGVLPDSYGETHS